MTIARLAFALLPFNMLVDNKEASIKDKGLLNANLQVHSGMLVEMHRDNLDKLQS